ncbi:hypothetical protein FJZ21_01625 [Candidatus Pacearchaeota archaeon]|nr:hypothetical protein [Candidatus Pacearchaeota archaeon]
MGRTSFDLGDKIVRDSLASLSVVNSTNPVVVGGLAVQIHCRRKSEFLRDTPDADILTPENMTYEHFLIDIFPRVAEYLRDNGYQVQPKKGRGNHCVKVMEGQNKQDSKTFFIHWTNFGKEVYAGFKDYVQKQINYSRFESFEGVENVRVAALEEILPLKVRRAIKFGRDRQDVVGPFYDLLTTDAEYGDWSRLSAFSLEGWKLKIEEMQRKLGRKVASCDYRDMAETYKLNKDLFDICLAARVFNEGLYALDFYDYLNNVDRILGHKEELR